MKKSEWLAEGKALSTNVSTSAFEIGRWLVRGEGMFLIKKPTGTSKKAWRAYRSAARADFDIFIREAAKATNLAEKTLRNYGLVVRRGVFVDGLSFAHHQEVMRCHYWVEGRNGCEGGLTKRKFDSMAATAILMDAQAGNWTVAQTRDEVSRRYPRPKTISVFHAVCSVRKIFEKVPREQRLDLIEELRNELTGMEKTFKTPFDPDSVSEQDSMPY